MAKCEFQPKQWVLVRDDEKEPWKLNIFSRKEDDDMFWCVSGWYYKCIPYEGNEHLLGKTDAPEEKKLDGWKVGDKVEVEYDTDKKWYGGKIIRFDPSHTNWFDDEKMPYYVRSECFKYNDGCAWCAARQLRRPEEKPEEKSWRPKEGEVVEVLVNDEWQTATFIFDDHTDCAPYRIRLQNEEKVWCTEEQVRPVRKKPEEFKFGDKVEWRDFDDGEWHEGLIIETDHSDVPYKVAATNGGVYWRRKEEVRRAKG